MEMPRKNTHWNVVGTKLQFEVVDLWGKGFGNSYQVTGYELKFRHLSEPEYRPAEVMEDLIKSEKIKII